MSGEDVGHAVRGLHGEHVPLRHGLRAVYVRDAEARAARAQPLAPPSATHTAAETADWIWWVRDGRRSA